MKLGKNQLALLLIIDEGTTFDKYGEILKYKVFTWEKGHSYKDLDGSDKSFFMMTADLKSIERLAARGLVTSQKLDRGFSISESGRVLLKKLREATPQAPPPEHDRDAS